MAEVIGALRWYLEIDGITEGAFREVGGLDSETEVIEHRVTGKGGNLIVHKVPGALKWSNITLKRGITDSMDMWQWRKVVEEGNMPEARKNGTITMYNQKGDPIARWNFINAWPSKLTGPSANAANNEVAIEELEITHEGYERVQ